MSRFHRRRICRGGATWNPCFTDKAQLSGFRNKPENAAIVLGNDNLMSPRLHRLSISRGLSWGLSWQMEGVSQAKHCAATTKHDLEPLEAGSGSVLKRHYR